jgi:hypothetical protein
MWSYVTKHFADFQTNINPVQNEYSDAHIKAQRIQACLHRTYYPELPEIDALLFVGSYGKKTAIKATSDVDLMYFLPHSVMTQYSNYIGNGQSALLQDFRIKLKETYPRTTIKADGQVVVIDYQSMRFEIVPAFIGNQGLLIPDTNNGGRWKPVDTLNEMETLDRLDNATQGHVRALIKYLKIWKKTKDVPLKSVILENAAIAFIQQWIFLNESLSYGGAIWWHDWMVRDFFEFLLKFNRLTLPYGEIIYFGDGWRQKTMNALSSAEKACHYERADQSFMAISHWQNIFGYQFPHQPLQKLEQLSVSRGLLGLIDG